MAYVMAGPGEKIKIQDAATTGAGLVIVPAASINYHSILIEESDDTTSAGKIKAESAPEPDFGGTWALEGTEQTLVRFTALQVNFVGARAAIRARISTDVTGGGKATVYYLGV